MHTESLYKDYQIDNVPSDVSMDTTDALSILKLAMNASGTRIDDLPLDIQLAIIDKCPKSISLFESPCIDVMEAAIDQNPYLVLDLINPPDSVKVKAIRDDSRIAFSPHLETHKLSEDAFVDAIRVLADIIVFARNPSRKLQETAIESLQKRKFKNKSFVISRITERDLKLQACIAYPEHLLWTSEDDSDLLKDIVRAHPDAIAYIREPDEDLQLISVIAKPDLESKIRGWKLEHDEHGNIVSYYSPYSSKTEFVSELANLLSGKAYSFAKWPSVHDHAILNLACGITGEALARKLVDVYRNRDAPAVIVEPGKMDTENAEMLVREFAVA